MKTLLLITVLTFVRAMASGQAWGAIEQGKTIGTHYRLPHTGIIGGYKTGYFTSEGGMKTNWDEYYTLFYLAAGVETKGRLLLGVNGGLGWTFTIPQLDRKFNPVTHETTVLHEGYESKSICAYYANGKVGYRFKFESVSIAMYAGYNAGFKEWYCVGIKIGGIKSN